MEARCASISFAQGTRQITRTDRTRPYIVPCLCRQIKSTDEARSGNRNRPRLVPPEPDVASQTNETAELLYRDMEIYPETVEHCATQATLEWKLHCEITWSVLRTSQDTRRNAFF
jgi:hypothetical protein